MQAGVRAARAHTRAGWGWGLKEQKMETREEWDKREVKWMDKNQRCGGGRRKRVACGNDPKGGHRGGPQTVTARTGRMNTASLKARRWKGTRLTHAVPEQ